MFRITEDPSSGSTVHCLAKNYKSDSIMSIDMDKVGDNGSVFWTAVRVCSSLYMKTLCLTSWIIKCLIIIDAPCKHEDKKRQV